MTMLPLATLDVDRNCIAPAPAKDERHGRIAALVMQAMFDAPAKDEGTIRARAELRYAIAMACADDIIGIVPAK